MSWNRAHFRRTEPARRPLFEGSTGPESRKVEQLSFPLTFGSRYSAPDLLRLGRYDEFDNTILAFAQHCTTTCAAAVRIFRSPHCTYHSTVNEVVESMRGVGLHPADLYELLALGAEYPEVQRFFPIVALGASKLSSAPMLTGSWNQRQLVFVRYQQQQRWDPSIHRFLCIRESQ